MAPPQTHPPAHLCASKRRRCTSLRYRHVPALLCGFLTLVLDTTTYAFAPTAWVSRRGTTATASPTLLQDARGSAVLLDHVSVYRGPAKILSNIDWRVEPRTKWALVGANGAGKSTLLQAIADIIPYEGTIAVGCSEESGIGYLKQTAVAGSNQTIYAEASAGMWRINEARQEMERAQEAADLNAIDRATMRFESLGGYQQEQKVHNVLKGLGFSPDTYNTMRCDELSGGWQMRVAFARQLLSEPELSLLDGKFGCYGLVLCE